MAENNRGRSRLRIQTSIRARRHTQYRPMSGDETWAYIKSQHKMILCSLDGRGMPHAAPIWYVVVDNKIYFRAQPYKKKIKNILRKPEVCCVVEGGEKYTELRGVMMQGLARVVDTDKVLRKQVFELLAEKYRDLRDTFRFPKSWQETYGKEHRVVVEFKPTNVVSWDNRKWIAPNQLRKT
jgi:nitroimidazol reductase NimA-like FMN-containing flavoprotein (pyridoxamine 5'-phosphate oxidase superfamily)